MLLRELIECRLHPCPHALPHLIGIIASVGAELAKHAKPD